MPVGSLAGLAPSLQPVSFTPLDVDKRQEGNLAGGRAGTGEDRAFVVPPPRPGFFCGFPPPYALPQRSL